jgi:hypothetical protein
VWNDVQQALYDSTTQVMTGLARLLPGVLALVLAVLVSGVLAWIASSLVQRALRGMRFDEQIATWGWLEVPVWSRHHPSVFIARVVAGAIVLVGVLIGIAAFDTTLTSSLVMGAFGGIPRLLIALVLIVVGYLLAQFLARGALIGAVNMNLPYAGLLGVGVKWLVLVLASAMALDHVGIGGNIVSLAFGIVFGGIVLALALAVGLGSKDVVARSIERELERPVDDESEGPISHI